MNNREKAVILTAMQKAIKNELTKVREETDADLRDLCEQTGATRQDILLNGIRVATLSLDSGGVPVMVTNDEALDDFLLCYGLAEEKIDRVDGWEKQLDVSADGIFFHGEPVPGVAFCPKAPKAVLRFDRGMKNEEVLQRASRVLNGDFNKLLAGEVE